MPIILESLSPPTRLEGFEGHYRTAAQGVIVTAFYPVGGDSGTWDVTGLRGFYPFWRKWVMARLGVLFCDRQRRYQRLQRSAG